MWCSCNARAIVVEGGVGEQSSNCYLVWRVHLRRNTISWRSIDPVVTGKQKCKKISLTVGSSQSNGRKSPTSKPRQMQRKDDSICFPRMYGCSQIIKKNMRNYMIIYVVKRHGSNKELIARVKSGIKPNYSQRYVLIFLWSVQTYLY